MSQYLYVEIASSLKGRIRRGDFEAGKLPSERELTSEYGVQRATVRRALQVLEAEGLIFRDTTRGTFARTPETRGTERGGIALVIGRAEDTTAPGDIARGLAQALREEERFLVWFDTPALPGHAEAEVPHPDDLLARGVVGCALWPQIPASVERLRALRDAMPLVLLDRRVPGFESDFVGIDDVEAARTVTEHLLELGHRRIGFVAVEPHVATVQARLQGWSTALMATGVPGGDGRTLFKNGDFSKADDRMLEDFLAGNGDPLTALVCTNDTVASQMIRFLQNSGRQIGKDVAVTGFGNSFAGLLDALGLTTVAQPWEAMGRMAGEMLLARLNDPQASDAGGPSRREYPCREAVLPVSLVIRRSCGSPIHSV
ncbi:MAG: GntR family transcriptional regulator [Capsulimonadales bacterium]|nr:GntR family transcriptional regulator [Capsulimonadales bacterium]